MTEGENIMVDAKICKTKVRGSTGRFYGLPAARGLELTQCVISRVSSTAVFVPVRELRRTRRETLVWFKQLKKRSFRA